MNYFLLVLLTTLGLLISRICADISVSMNPQSKQVPLYKDVFMSCEFRFSPSSPNQASPPLEETGSEIVWLKQTPGTSMFRPVVQSKGTGYMARTVKVRVLSYNEEKQTKSSSLEVRRISEADAGYYKCIIGGGKTAGGQETNVAQLQIVPGISVSPSVVSIEPDRPFRIYCNVTSTQQGSRFSPGGPRGLGGGVLDNTITWTYASTRLVDPDDPIAMQRLMETARQLSSLPKLQFDVSADGSIVSVRRARMEHAGYYWCTYEASQQGGMFQGRVHQRAIVRYGPTYQLDQFNHTNSTRTVKAFVGGTVDLYCNIVSLPFARVEWFRNTRRIGHDQIRHENSANGRRYFYHLMRDKSGFPTILRMNDLQYEDRDEYICNVTAFGIRQSWSTLLKVKDKYSAFFPLGVIVTQMVLIFTLIFGAEKVYSNKGGHSHGHSHGHARNHTSHVHLPTDTTMDHNGTIRSRAMTLSGNVGAATAGSDGRAATITSNPMHHHSQTNNLSPTHFPHQLSSPHPPTASGQNHPNQQNPHNSSRQEQNSHSLQPQHTATGVYMSNSLSRGPHHAMSPPPQVPAPPPPPPPQQSHHGSTHHHHPHHHHGQGGGILSIDQMQSQPLILQHHQQQQQQQYSGGYDSAGGTLVSLHRSSTLPTQYPHPHHLYGRQNSPPNSYSHTSQQQRGGRVI
ncbi:uncharacterized protein LOC134840418 [Symsagittifera roscoffensis]|uniref:uncharacterized protein LOC134840418 n=1 Tax=Symsagittifera roscoffensis TaxID=84072 RepID=UPI00307B5B80